MVTNRRLVDEEGPDFYPTPEWGTLALIQQTKFVGEVLEPCCGDGAMSSILIKHGYKVISSDLYNRGYGGKKDFFDYNNQFDNIVTNPPFNIAEQVLAHALKLARFKIALLLRTAFLESKRRYLQFYQTHPPTRLLVFTERLSMYPAGHPVQGGGTTSYAWFIWDQQSITKTTEISWVPPGLKNSKVQLTPFTFSSNKPKSIIVNTETQIKGDLKMATFAQLTKAREKYPRSVIAAHLGVSIPQVDSCLKKEELSEKVAEAMNANPLSDTDALDKLKEKITIRPRREARQASAGNSTKKAKKTAAGKKAKKAKAKKRPGLRRGKKPAEAPAETGGEEASAAA